MESRVLPEIVLKRKVCKSCGEGIFEFSPISQALEKYICTDCLTCADSSTA